MDPAALATVAVTFVTPYLIDFVKNVASDAASEGSKSVWAWIKDKLTTPAGAEAVTEAERDPKDPANARALQAAVLRALKADPDAAKTLEGLLKQHGASLSSQSANVVGDNNEVGQASGGSSVNIS